ncbi:MAG: lysophospholipase [Bacteroidetes bacterium]|nr:MAG: lysophospholipase [Bacteroidota bacterium]PTM11657.1 MAG: lysophospholipase [Bacteroidota bacterium]
MIVQILIVKYVGYLWLLFLVVSSCSQEELPRPAGPFPPLPTPAVVVPDTFSYLALGDSYTIGQSVAVGERYPVQLGDSLLGDSTVLFPLDIVARTGWTTEDLAAGIAARTDLAAAYDLVSLLIGVNNQYQNRPLAAYETTFRQLLNQAVAFAGGRPERVFVVSIPDYAFTPFGGGQSNISAGIDAFNAANRTITEELGIAYFDITPISREGLNDPGLVASDGLHPSGKQYARWVSLLLPGVKALLE